jgi:ribosome-associated protein
MIWFPKMFLNIFMNINFITNKIMESVKLKDKVLKEVENLKALNPVVLDVKNSGIFTDYIMVLTATSSTHMRAISQAIIKSLKDMNLSLLGSEGFDGEDWILLDAGDAVVHIMSAEARSFYDLEGLWDLE